jgi:hypothetical protein
MDEVAAAIFFSRVKDVYPRYDFASTNDEEFGETMGLD